MGAPPPANFEALEAQARTLLAVFIAAGHEAVAPPIIQPAGVFLDVLGEALRGRTYVFTDLNGEELCLRPDLTVPTCRLHLGRNGAAAEGEAHYCYNGPAFRFQPQDADAAHPREFRQAGIEVFGVQDREDAEARTLALVLTALRQAGLRTWELRIGDLALFDAVLAAADMPERWRRRLRHQFWRPEAFRAELKRLTTNPARSAGALPVGLLDRLAAEPERAEALVAEHLDKEGIELIGTRSLSEIAEGLLAVAADAKAEPLSPAEAAMIDGYLTIATSAPQTADAVRALTGKPEPGIEAALAAFTRRNTLLKESGIDMSQVAFSGEFGRNVAYYTGFVFEVLAPGLGPQSPVAGGGRYDGLLKAVGARQDAPAVGGAIHTERLLAAVRGGKR